MEAVAIDTVWVAVAGCLVLFMQAGFATLEVGFSRMKNAGAVMAKVLINLSFAFFAFWAIGYALAFGDGNDFVGATGWFIDLGNPDGVESLSYTGVSEEIKFFFQATFAAVTLAIVWGSMLDRVAFRAYLPFAIAFVGVIYPIVVHWQWGGGWLLKNGFQDFAGAGVVHVCGATAALAGALIVGPRIGKYRDGRSIPIPGHSMPLAILGVLILWFGWQGFNAGSWFAAVDQDIGRVLVVTNLSGAAGVIGGLIMSRVLLGTMDIGMMGNGAVAGLGAAAGASGFVDPWAGAIIGLSAGMLMVVLVIVVDRLRVDDPIGAVAGHGGGGFVGLIGTGLFANAAGVEALGGREGLLVGGTAEQLGWQLIGFGAIFGFTFVTTAIVFFAIEKTIGLRASEDVEIQGLDIAEHGMFGYPEQFIEVFGASSDDAIPGISSPSGTSTNER